MRDHPTFFRIRSQLPLEGRGLDGVRNHLLGDDLIVVAGLQSELVGEGRSVDQLLSGAHGLDLGILALDLALLLSGGRSHVVVPEGRQGSVLSLEREDGLVGARVGGGGNLCGLGVL
jgi:hypothetical protein